MELSKDDIVYIVEEAVKRTLSHRYIPIIEKRVIGDVCLDEALIRSVPLKKVYKHFLSKYNFGEFYNFNPLKHAGIIFSDVLNNGTDVIIIYVDSGNKAKFCEEIMAKMGWIMSSNDIDIQEFPHLTGYQFEKKERY